MASEQMVNLAETTLAAAMTAATTTAELTSETGFLESGNYRVTIDSEIMLVTARSGKKLTVKRGQEGTTAVEHAKGAVIAATLTKEALELLFADQIGEGEPTSTLAKGTFYAQANKEGTITALWIGNGPSTPIKIVEFSGIPAKESVTTEKLAKESVTAEKLSAAVKGAGTWYTPSVVSAPQSRTNTAYGLLETPDKVSGVVVPTNGLLLVAFGGFIRSSVAQAGRAALFVGSTQILGEAVTSEVANAWRGVTTVPPGLAANPPDLAPAALVVPVALSGPSNGGMCVIAAPGGTYDVSVKFKASSGSVSASNRYLWVWTIG